MAEATKLYDAGRELTSILVERDRPTWLAPITNSAQQFVSRKDVETSRALIRALLENYQDVRPIEVQKDSDSFDFDSLFARLREEKRIPELFDEMIAQISSMLESSEIESITVFSALRRLIDILRANQKGSSVAVKQSIVFATFIKNCCIEYLKKIPGIKEAVDAWEKTIKETSDAYDELDKVLCRKSIELVLDAKLIDKVKAIPSATHDILTLPSPSRNARED